MVYLVSGYLIPQLIKKIYLVFDEDISVYGLKRYYYITLAIVACSIFLLGTIACNPFQFALHFYRSIDPTCKSTDEYVYLLEKQAYQIRHCGGSSVSRPGAVSLE